MTPSGDRIRPDRIAARLQRREEVLAIYAQQRLGFRLTEFCKNADIEPRTWYEWLKDPDFNASVAEIQEQRRKIVLEPLERDLGDIVSAHSRAGRSGEGWAVRLAYEVLGLIKPPNSSVKVNTIVSANAASADVETTQEEIIAEHERLRVHVLRLAQRARSIEGDSGDPGPSLLGGGPPEEPGTPGGA